MNNYDNERRSNPMATAAIVLGIISLVLSSTFYIAIPCGAIAVICAILSRDNHPMPNRAKIGVLLGIAGLVVSLILTANTFRYVLGTSEGRSMLQYYYQYYTGDSSFDVDEALDTYFPFLGGSSDESNEGEGDSGDAAQEAPADGSDSDDSSHSNPDYSYPNEGPGEFV